MLRDCHVVGLVLVIGEFQCTCIACGLDNCDVLSSSTLSSERDGCARACTRVDHDNERDLLLREALIKTSGET